jgi:hypothetical protein
VTSLGRHAEARDASVQGEDHHGRRPRSHLAALGARTVTRHLTELVGSRGVDGGGHPITVSSGDVVPEFTGRDWISKLSIGLFPGSVVPPRGRQAGGGVQGRPGGRGRMGRAGSDGGRLGREAQGCRRTSARVARARDGHRVDMGLPPDRREEVAHDNELAAPGAGVATRAGSEQQSKPFISASDGPAWKRSRARPPPLSRGPAS